MVKETLYSLDEVVLLPAPVSDISSRSQCSPYVEGTKLPIFIAPMSCLTDENNYSEFESLGFSAILPRNIRWDVRKQALLQGKWIAVSLDEGSSLLKDADVHSSTTNMKICIDIANGHQETEFALCRELKSTYGKRMTVMVGNIAHPVAYFRYGACGADYVRIGIGTGHVCTTTVQTGIHYPMASLIDQCKQLQSHLKGRGYNVPKIVADGGFHYIDQIVKALALGADYAMIGSIAASFPEACGYVETDEALGEVIRQREYYGMSTEKAQRLMHPEPDYVLKHTEGTVRWIDVIPSTQTWIDDFTHALKSSMSYCNAHNLQEYCGKVEWAIQTPTTFKAYIKS